MSKSSSIIQYGLLGLIVAAAFILMFNASLKESATMDELAHIPSGYGYVKYLDYRLNPEHPPLIKALAAFPLLFQKLNFPVQNRYWQKDVNGQWAVGAQFLYESGNNADEIIQWSRLGPMLYLVKRVDWPLVGVSADVFIRLFSNGFGSRPLCYHRYRRGFRYFYRSLLLYQILI